MTMPPPTTVSQVSFSPSSATPPTMVVSGIRLMKMAEARGLISNKALP